MSATRRTLRGSTIASVGARSVRSLARRGRALAQALARRRPGLDPAGVPPLALARCASLDAFATLRAATVDARVEDARRERELLGRAALQGHCVLCARQVVFRLDPGPAGAGEANWREGVVCTRCGLNSRHRAALHVLFGETSLATDARLYVTEQASPLYEALRSVHRNTIGSEFIGPGRGPGERVGSLRHEGLQRLSFADDALGAVLCLDVLEHVPVLRQALCEIHRVLAPGVVLASVPLRHDRYEHQVRARLGPGGAVEHLHAPEYHTNPFDRDGGGSLVYAIPGWKLLDDMREIGFADPEVLYYRDERFG